MTVLIAGATGQLGGTIARKLLRAGVPVRALGRNPTKLDALATLGAQTIPCDLRDRAAVDRACRDVEQVVTTANNVMGRGANSPNRVDVLMHHNLSAAAKANGVRRILYIGARGVGGADSPVDYFRVKHQVEQVIKGCGVPYVVLSPSAFMDLWVPMIGDGIVAKHVATLFGDGTSVCNYIAVDDVAEIATRILGRREIENETIEIGGPSTISLNDLATMIETTLGVSARRRRIPVPLLRWGSMLLRPVHEVASRMMSLGYFTATNSDRFDDWPRSMKRFDVSPMTLEAFVSAKYRR